MKTHTQQMTLIALFLALCIVVPIFFHLISPQSGQMFLPMFLPILLASFVIRFPGGLFVGLLGPFISSLITGMPPLIPGALMMSFEGVAMAGLANYIYYKSKLSLWIPLVIAIIGGRVAFVLWILVLTPLLGLPSELFSVGGLLLSLPGIILQLILIPIFVKALMKFKLLELPQ
jgi:hypothetical protein